MQQEHVVIIGNGIAGVTAARHIRKLSDKRITIVSAESKFFFSRTALMYVFMGHMRFEDTQPYEPWFWKKNRIELKQAFVEAVDVQHKTLYFSERDQMKYDQLIIATGSTPNKFGWPGENAKGVLGLYHKQDLEELEKYAPNNSVCKRAVIVGGGLIGIELAEMLNSRNIPVTFLVREHSFWNNVLPNEESEMIHRHILEHHIDVRRSTHLKAIHTNEDGKVKSITMEESNEEISCDLVCLTAGVRPNIDFLKNSTIELGKGVLVDRFLATSEKGIYAIGDCAEQRTPIGNRNVIEAVWYTGRMMGESVARTICGNKTPYNPGHWFNSAKFFDIEYQTYGWVSSQTKKDEEQFYWEHGSGKKALRINFNRLNRQFIGINTFGLRMRHSFFDQALSKQLSVEDVLTHLRDANFDPEFYKRHEVEIIEKFNREQNTNIQLKKNRLFNFIFK